VGNVTTEKKRSVLIVDDEKNILNAVRRELMAQPLGRHRFEIEAFTNPLEALERARAQEFEVVLSDYRMPEMDGISFLQAFAALQPDCVRIVLSGQTDFDALIRMINEMHIYRFIPKPWKSQFLKSLISQAVDFRQSNVENRRMAETLREHGIVLPIGSVSPVDQILVVSDDIKAANTIVRKLTQRNSSNEVIRQTREEAPDRFAELGPGKISVQILESAFLALKMAEEVTFSCVIADFRMPSMDGAHFLASFSEKQPDCACILISGESSMEGVIIALHLAQIHAFIGKPWIDFELRATVAQALTKRRLLLENRILAEMRKARNSAPTTRRLPGMARVRAEG